VAGTDGTITLAAAGDTLAITGVNPVVSLIAAALLLLGGLAFLLFGRRARSFGSLLKVRS